MGRLDDKVAIITASAQGMGRASVLRFVQEGALVVAADINRAGGEAVIGECKGPGKAVFQHTDLTREEEVAALIARAVKEFGRLNVVFNVAGNIPPDGPLGPPELTTAAGWDKVMALTLRSPFLMIEACASRTAPSGRRIDHQCRLGRGLSRRSLSPGLLRRQGGRDQPHAGDGHDCGQRPDSDQLHLPRMDQHSGQLQRIGRWRSGRS